MRVSGYNKQVAFQSLPVDSVEKQVVILTQKGTEHYKGQLGKDRRIRDNASTVLNVFSRGAQVLRDFVDTRTNTRQVIGQNGSDIAIVNAEHLNLIA